MRLTPVAWSLVGSLVVFVACSANIADRSSGPAAHDSGVVAVADAVADAAAVVVHDVASELGVDVSITPEKDAKAGPTDPTTVTVACDKSYQYGGGSLYYAETLVPGRGKVDLARSIGMRCGLAGFAGPTGYECQSAAVYPKDGAIAVFCGGASSLPATVTFIIPPPLSP